jgi:hypothetical protein
LNYIQDITDRIIILDNDSTYPPLIEFYNSLKGIEIVYLKKNIGHTALYKWKEHLKFKERYFVYTDSDIVPKETCPKDVLQYLLQMKMKYKRCNKIGLALEINDIPDCYKYKQDVINHESKFWKKKRGNLFRASVDTTFAIYDNLHKASKRHHYLRRCLRTDYPYVARHIPWYSDSAHLDEEERYYLRNATARWKRKPVGKWTYLSRMDLKQTRFL